VPFLKEAKDRKEDMESPNSCAVLEVVAWMRFP